MAMPAYDPGPDDVEERAPWAPPPRARLGEPDEQAQIEALWHALDLPGHKIELVDGRIVVSPTASGRHQTVVRLLERALTEIEQRNGWWIWQNVTIFDRFTRDRYIPDLLVVADGVPMLSDHECYADAVLLAAEVVSPSSRRYDMMSKREAYARAGVPLYLILDPGVPPPAGDAKPTPASVICYARPDGAGFSHAEQVEAGKPLELPKPFGVTLDTATLFP